MAPRSGIIAGKTVIVVQVQESIDSALNSISSKLNKFSAKIGRLGLEMFSGGLLGTLAGKGAVDQFVEFQDRILFLKTKLTATAREFSMLEERIRELGRSTSFTAAEVADGAIVLAQAGLNAKEAAETLQSTLDLARGAQIEMGQAGAILVNTMRSFSMETSRANEVASQFIAAARLGTLDVLDLKESIKEVLGTVRTLNIDLPTTLALLTQMAERSLKGTKAGTSLNTALLNLASKSQVLKETLGITLPDNINGEGFIEFLETLYNRINRLGNLQRVAILQQLFNIRGGRAITALDDIGKIVRLQKAIRGAGDEARNAAVTMDSGLGGSFRRAKSAAESLYLTLVGLTEKALTPITDLVPAVANAFEKLAVNNEMLVIGMLATPPLLLGIGAGLLTLSFVGAKAAAILGGLALSFRAITGGAITVLNSQLVLLTRTMNTFFGRVQRQGKGAKLDKKGGLFQQFDELLSAKLLSPQKVGGRGRNAQKTRPTSFFGRVGNAELTYLGILKKTVSALVLPFNLVRRVAAGFMAVLRTPANTLINNIAKALGSGLTKAFSALYRTIKKFDIIRFFYNFTIGTGSLLRGLLSFANGVRRFVFSFGGILTIIELLIVFGPKIGFIRDAFTRLGKGLSDAFRTIAGTFEDLAPVFSLFGAGFGNIFKGEGELGIQGLISGFRKLVTIVQSNLKIAFLQVVEAIAPLYDFLRNIVLSLLEVFNLLGSIAGITFNNIGAGVQALTGGGAGGFLEGVTNAIKQAFSRENIKAAFTFVGAFFIELARGIQNIMQSIFVVINNLASFIQNALVSMFDGILKASLSIVESTDIGLLKDIFLSIAGAAEGSRNSLMPQANAAQEAGNKIVEGFKIGNDALDKTFQAFTDKLNAIFGVNTEADSKLARDLAFADKILAMEAADRQARDDAVGTTPLTQIGKVLGNIRNGTIFADSIIKGANAISPFIGKNQVDWLRLGTDIFNGVRNQYLEQVKKQPVGGVPPQTLADIVSATVGTFQSTRNNLLKVAGGKSIDQQQLEGINQLVTNTGGKTNTNLFKITEDLSKRAQPFVFQ